jgi:PAS domain S-box-containing protein
MHMIGAKYLSLRKCGILNILLVLFYVLLGNSGYLLSNYISNGLLLWPASGVSLAIVIVCGLRKVIPGIVIGITLLAFKSDAPLFTILGLIISNITEVVIASMLLKSFGEGKFRFKSPKDIFGFILIATILAPFISSTITVTFLYIGNLVSVNNFLSAWRSHFFANGLGILLVTPLLLSFHKKDFRKMNLLEVFVLYSALAFACYLSFHINALWQFMIIPILTWAALRFSFRGISISTIILGLLAVWTSANIQGVFVKHSAEVDFLLIQLVMSGISIVGYFLATVVEVEVSVQEKELELSIKEDALAILDQSLHHSPIGFALIDRDYKYIRVNETLSRMNGLDANSHLGQSIQDIYPLSAEREISIISEVFRTGNSFMNLPFNGVSQNKSQKIVAGLLSYYPVRHPSTNEIFAVAYSVQDITEQLNVQMLLRENQERMRFAQEAGKIGAFEWDLTTQRILWTKELESIYELGPGEFGGYSESWLKMVHPSDVDNLKKEMDKVFSGERELNFEFRIITKSGFIHWILARAKLMKDSEGYLSKLIGINIDITEQKLIEQKLRLTEAGLLSALSVRDDFMAIASHELKTPLTSLKLQFQIFERGIMKNDSLIYTSERIKSFITKNTNQIDRLNRLVDDMLDISRLRTGKFSINKEPCELGQLLESILFRFKDQFEACGSGVPVVENIEKSYGEWDSHRIEQVLTNIITNSIRYGGGKPISISIKNYEESVRFSVKDQGIGIPKSHHEKIFHVYERGSDTRDTSGLGLGLFITRQIVEAHGGKIWVESDVNQGSIFHVDLPRLIPVFLNSSPVTEEENS